MNGVEVNVYSDASIKKSGAAWGCVVVRPGAEPIEASGRFATLVEYRGWTTVAELKAAANALHHALKARLIKPGDRVVIRSDNQSAVLWINGEATFRRSKARNNPDCLAVVAWINGEATARGFEVSAQWVPAHQRADSPDPHARHNRRADQLCGLVNATARVRKSRRRPNKRTRDARARAVAAPAPDWSELI